MAAVVRVVVAAVVRVVEVMVAVAVVVAVVVAVAVGIGVVVVVRVEVVVVVVVGIAVEGYDMKSFDPIDLVLADSLSTSERETLDVLNEARVRCRRYLSDHKNKLLPRDAVDLLALCERREARLRADSRKERLLQAQLALVARKLGPIDQDSIDDEIRGLVAGALARMTGEQLRKLALVRDVEARALDLAKKDSEGVS